MKRRISLPGAIPARAPSMRHLTLRQRLAVTGAMCSALIVAAGLVALSGGIGIAIASLLLTAAIVAGLVGSAYASDSTLGLGVVAVIAATFPLFLGLYVIGMNIFARLGGGVAGGVLIGLGAGIALVSLVLWLSERSAAAGR